MSSPALKQSSDSSQNRLDSEQDAAVTRLVEHDHTLLYARMGAGKTIIALTAVAELLRDRVLKRVLVVAPKKVALTTWPDEVERWSFLQPHVQMAVCVGPEKKRRSLFENLLSTDFNVVVINHDVLGWAADNFDLLGLFDGLIVDEIGKLSETGGARFKRFRRHIRGFTWRLGMTGTPVTEGLEKLFGQMLIVDGGKTLGRAKQRYLDEFFIATDFHRRSWAPRESAVGEIARKIAPYVYTMPDYRHTLPPLEMEWVDVEMPPATRQVYEELRRENVWADVECVNEGVLTNKLLQVPAGFLYVNPDDSLPDDGLAWYELDSAKFDVAAKLMRAAIRPLLVVYWWEVQKHWLLDHGVPIFDERTHLEPWNAGEIRLLGIHPRSCGHGLNLQYGGHDMLWLGPQWSLDLHEQVIARLHRRGQTHPVRCTVLTSPNTMDVVARARLEGKAEWVKLFDQHLHERG